MSLKVHYANTDGAESPDDDVASDIVADSSDDDDAFGLSEELDGSSDDADNGVARDGIAPQKAKCSVPVASQTAPDDLASQTDHLKTRSTGRIPRDVYEFFQKLSKEWEVAKLAACARFGITPEQADRMTSMRSSLSKHRAPNPYNGYRKKYKAEHEGISMFFFFPRFLGLC
jgi:hypothetical protein